MSFLRIGTSSPVFSMGFRPFFIMVVVFAIVPVSIWTLQYSGVYAFDYSPLTAIQWHANEMIFGFTLSAIIGFLLTASANWTSSRGLHGFPLFALFALFVMTRLLFIGTFIEEIWLYRLVSLIAPFTLVVYLAFLFIKTNNNRNLILVVPLAILAIGQFLVLSSDYPLGFELSLYSVRFLIVVIAGRVIPFFTRKALNEEPKWSLPYLEHLTIISVFILIFEPLYRDFGTWGESVWVFSTAVALFLNIFRILNWRLIRSFNVKILFVLYVAYLWLPIHFALNLATHFLYLPKLGNPNIHALTFGCMGLMIIGIIHRVSLGHTGRAIRGNATSHFAYLLLGVGAVTRVFGPIVSPSNYIFWIKLSGVFWIVSFLMIGIVIVPMLLTARIDGKEY